MDCEATETKARTLLSLRTYQLPGSNTNLRLYSSEIEPGSTPARSRLFPLRMFSKSTTFLFDNRLMLVCHEVDPVPVDTHRPELLVFVIFCVVLGRMCR